MRTRKCCRYPANRQLRLALTSGTGIFTDDMLDRCVSIVCDEHECLLFASGFSCDHSEQDVLASRSRQS